MKTIFIRSLFSSYHNKPLHEFHDNIKKNKYTGYYQGNIVRILAVSLAISVFVIGLSGCSGIWGLFGKNTERSSDINNNNTDKAPNRESEAEFEINQISTVEILEIAKKYYNLARSEASAEELIHIASFHLVPDFTGATSDIDKAAGFSYPTAYITACTDLKNVYLALCAAVFTLDTKNPASAGNLASAIVTYIEDLREEPFASIYKEEEDFTKDAAKVYQYALSLYVSEKKVNIEALPLLLTCGYFCIDIKQMNMARKLFETAVRLEPDYFPANEGLAAYWFAAGNQHKAKQILKDAKKPVLYAVIKKGTENTSEEKAPVVEEGDDLPATEEKLDKLAEVPILLATDFYENFDPEGVADAKRFVENLAAEWKYTAPNYDYLSQYSTLKVFKQGPAQAAFEAFRNMLAEFAQKQAITFVNYQQNLMQNTGLDIDFGGIDLNDIINNPEKYKDKDIEVNVKGLDDFINRMTRFGENAEKEMKKGNFDSLKDLMTATAPENIIFTLNPGDYANPTDVLTQQYNMTILNRKLKGYKHYFTKQLDELEKVIREDAEKLSGRTNKLISGRDMELELLRKEHNESHDTSGDCDICTIKKHTIHQKYHPQLNQLNETVWMDATNFVNSRYTSVIKKNIEAFYADTMRNCMLISDPEIRKRKEDEIKTEVYSTVIYVFSAVIQAYGMYSSNDYPYECDCDPAAVAAARERERKAFEEAEANKTLMHNKARVEFEKGTIMESSQMYQRLDKYSAEIRILFMHAKWHPLKTKVTFGLPFNNINADLGWTTEHVRNTTTINGGLSAVLKGPGVGPLSTQAVLATRGQATVDENWNIISYDATGGAGASIGLGPLEASAAAEIPLVHTIRGCKVSSQVTMQTEYEVNPPAELIGPIGDIVEGMKEIKGIFLPSDKPKKVLWSGEYKP